MSSLIYSITLWLSDFTEVVAEHWASDQNWVKSFYSNNIYSLVCVSRQQHECWLHLECTYQGYIWYDRVWNRKKLYWNCCLFEFRTMNFKRGKIKMKTKTQTQIQANTSQLLRSVKFLCDLSCYWYSITGNFEKNFCSMLDSMI